MCQKNSDIWDAVSIKFQKLSKLGLLACSKAQIEDKYILLPYMLVLITIQKKQKKQTPKLDLLACSKAQIEDKYFLVPYILILSTTHQ